MSTPLGGDRSLMDKGKPSRGSIKGALPPPLPTQLPPASPSADAPQQPAVSDITITPPPPERSVSDPTTSSQPSPPSASGSTSSVASRAAQLSALFGGSVKSANASPQLSPSPPPMHSGSSPASASLLSPLPPARRQSVGPPPLPTSLLSPSNYSSAPPSTPPPPPALVVTSPIASSSNNSAMSPMPGMPPLPPGPVPMGATRNPSFSLSPSQASSLLSPGSTAAAAGLTSPPSETRRPSMAPPPLPVATHRGSAIGMKVPPPPPPPLPGSIARSPAPSRSNSIMVSPSAAGVGQVGAGANGITPIPLSLPVATTPSLEASASPAPSTPTSTNAAPSFSSPPPASAVASPPVDEEIPEEVDPGKSAEERKKRFNFRKKVAQEMLSTEQSYVASLDMLQNVYIKQMLGDDRHSGIISQEQCDTLFSNISVLRPFQHQFLVQMKEILDKWSPTTQEIGTLFLKFAPFLKMYSSYVNNYDYSTELLTKLNRSESFQTFVRKIKENNPGLMDLASYLIMPIQRVPRYKLLIAEMLRYTNPSHVDYQLLTKAADLMSEVALHINEAVRKQQNTQMLLNLQNDKFSGSIHLIGPNTNGIPGQRRIVKQGPLAKKGRRSDTVYEFLLFTDFLIYARPVGFVAASQMKLKLHRKIFIDANFKFSDVADTSAGNANSITGLRGEDQGQYAGERHCIQILSAQKSFIVYARDAREKTEWMSCLQEVVTEFNKAADSNSSGNGSAEATTNGTAPGSNAAVAAPTAEFGTQQPIFQQFKPNSACYMCNTKCSFTTGRHHCRACGKIVCGNCSRDRIYLSWTKQCSRTCDKCCQRMKDERSAKLERMAKLAQANAASVAASTSATPAPATPLVSPLTSPTTAGAAAAASITSPTSGVAPPIPPRPSIPARPHQDQLFRLLNELLETAPRIETTTHATSHANNAGGASAGVKARAMSVFVRPNAVQTNMAKSPIMTGSTVSSTVAGGLSVTSHSNLGDVPQSAPPMAGGLNASAEPASAPAIDNEAGDVVSAMEPIPKYQEGTEKPRVVGRLEFIRPRGLKTRSHSVMVPGAQSSLLSPQSGDGWENDGLSDSDDDDTASQMSTLSTPTSMTSLERNDSGPLRSHRLSFGEAVVEETETQKQAEESLPAESPQPPVAVPTIERQLSASSAAAVSTVAASSTSAALPSPVGASTPAAASHPPPPPPPPSVKYWCMARVLFPFTATDSTQLSLNAGDVVLITDKSHDDWWKGESYESPPRRGLIPSSFLFELKDVAPAIFESLGEYNTRNETEGHLSIALGDLLYVRQKHSNGWWQAQHAITRNIGWVPSNFLQLYNKFPALTKEQEDKLVHILARSQLPAAPLPPSSSSSTASPAPSPSSVTGASPSDSASPPPIPGRPNRLSIGGSSPSAVSNLQRKLAQSMTLGAPLRASKSFSIQSSSPAQAAAAAQELISPQSASYASPPPVTNGASAGDYSGMGSSPRPAITSPPALPARTVRSHSLLHLNSAQLNVAPSPERMEKRKSIMDTLVGFFTLRPSRESLVAKNIIHSSTS